MKLWSINDQSITTENQSGNGHLLSLGNASKFCHKALNYSSIFSVSDGNNLPGDTPKTKVLRQKNMQTVQFFLGQCQVGLFFEQHQTQVHIYI